jgi:hypothetical protein
LVLFGHAPPQNHSFSMSLSPIKPGRLAFVTRILAALLMGTFLSAGADKPTLRLAYFVPSDRQPIPGYVGHIERIVREVHCVCMRSPRFFHRIFCGENQSSWVQPLLPNRNGP